MPQVTKSKHSAVCYTKSFSCVWLCNPTDCSPPGSSVHWDSPGKNTGVGCHALLQGIFPTQRSNLGLLHRRWTPYHLSHQGSPRILEWVAYTHSGDLPDPGIEPGSLALQADSSPAGLPGNMSMLLFQSVPPSPPSSPQRCPHVHSRLSATAN